MWLRDYKCGDACDKYVGLEDVQYAQRFAVWAAADVEGTVNCALDDKALLSSDAELVGFSGRCLFHVCPVLVQTGAASVSLIVQSRSLDCSWNPLADSGHVVVQLPDTA